MDTKVQLKSMTSTSQAVMLTVGMIGAFFVGISMMFALPKYLIIEDEPLIVRNTPMRISDVTALNTSLDYYSPTPILWYLELGGTTSTGPVNFGHWGIISKYEDGSKAATAVPLAIKLWGNKHASAIVTFQTGPFQTAGTPSCSDTDPTDSASVKGKVTGVSGSGQAFTYEDVCSFKTPSQLIQYKCVNDPNGAGTLPSSTSSTCPEGCGNGACLPGGDPKTVSLFGIPEANAQTLTTSTKQTICIPEINRSGAENALYTYYVDYKGNLYYDSTLSQRVSPIDCATITDKGYSPNNISDISSTGTIDFGSYNGTPGRLTFMKALHNFLGTYNTADGFKDMSYDSIGSEAPIALLGMSYKDGVNSIPEQTVTVKSELGTLGLCFPAQQLDKYESFAIFYDTAGKPYGDLTLSTRIPCGEQVITEPVCKGDKSDPVSCFIYADPAL